LRKQVGSSFERIKYVLLFFIQHLDLTDDARKIASLQDYILVHKIVWAES